MQEYIKKLRYPLLILSGVLTAIGVVYPGAFGLLAWISMIPAALVLLSLGGKAKGGSMYLYGFVFYYAYYVVSYHWFISMYPMDFTGMTPEAAIGVIALAVLGISALQAALSALIIMVFGWFCRTALLQRFPLLKPLLMACLWVVNEWSQTIGWTGVPWARLYLTQGEILPMIQSASLLGSIFVSFLIVAVNFAFAGAILEKKQRLSHVLLGGSMLCGNLLFGFAAMDAVKGNALPWQIGFFAAALVSVIFAAVYGLWRKLRTDARLLKSLLGIALMLCVLSSAASVLGGYADTGAPIRVAALQGNLSSKDKWAEDSGLRSFHAYADLTKQAAADGATLIVWPETALNYHLFDVSPNSTKKAPLDAVHDLVQQTNATVLVCTFVQSQYFDPNAEPISMNTVIAFYPDRTYDENIYCKRMLVPFGEYVPWREFLTKAIPVLGEINVLDSDVGRGEKDVSIQTKTLNVGLGPIVCYDSIYEEPVRQTVLAGAQIITASTNDSWFSDSAAVYMHNNHDRFRAVENGRYLVRSANTGVSSIFTPTGEVLDELGALQTGLVISEVHARDVQTLYTQVGYLIVWISIGAQIVLIIAQIAHAIKNRKKSCEKERNLNNS
ncbi:MAG: apolipoprotein N-acyltransferase [Clostridia bacterium]|nr:apolipoprotein N-acyltransferase [Clostridia bacterium]